MPEPEFNVFAQLKRETAALREDVAEMVGARWELANLEMQASSRQLRRLVLAAVVCLLLITVGLVALVVVGADALGRATRWSRETWLAILGGMLVVVGILGAILSWWRFRRDFTGMQHSLAELHEDLLWLKEWSERT